MLGSFIQHSIFGTNTPMPAVLSYYQHQREPFRLPVSIIIFYSSFLIPLLGFCNSLLPNYRLEVGNQRIQYDNVLNMFLLIFHNNNLIT